MIRYHLSPIHIIKRLLERSRKIYMKPFTKHDPNNRFEPLDVAKVEEHCKYLGLPIELYYEIHWIN